MLRIVLLLKLLLLIAFNIDQRLRCVERWARFPNKRANHVWTSRNRSDSVNWFIFFVWL